MTSNRKRLSKAIENKVLNEYNHMCAICGAPRPHIHHIDENPENNDLFNLLPLCPSHHLSDIHNPTKKMDHLKLSLFRKYKDPQILSPQFEPVFQRLRFLLVPFENVDQHTLGGLGVELAVFIEGFTMGEFYCKRLLKLMEWPQPRSHTAAEKGKALEENAAVYIKQLHDNKNRILELCIEMLRYQTWPHFSGEQIIQKK